MYVRPPCHKDLVGALPDVEGKFPRRHEIHLGHWQKLRRLYQEEIRRQWRPGERDMVYMTQEIQPANMGISGDIYIYII